MNPYVVFLICDSNMADAQWLLGDSGVLKFGNKSVTPATSCRANACDVSFVPRSG
jgi:hypothetical protein